MGRVPLYVQDGYIVCFQALPEERDLVQYWQEVGTPDALIDTMQDFAWFTAEVSLWKDGEEKACAYLGACCYKNESDFYTTYRNSYFEDMVRTCLQELPKC